MRTRRSLVALLAIVLACGAVRAADEAYSIQLHRPFKVGDRYDTHIVIDRTRTVTVDTGAPAPRVQTDKAGGDLTGRIEVTDVDKTGSPQAMVLTVKTLADADGKEILESGKEIVIKRDAKEITFTLANGELSADAKALLGNMFSKHQPEGPTDDDIFGSKDLHKAGDQWSLDAAKAAENLSQSGTTVAQENLTGKVTLKGAEAAGAVPALRVEGNLDAKKVTPGSVDSGVMVTSCSMQVTFSGLFPIDSAIPVADCKTVVDMQMHALVTGTPTNYDVKAHMVHTETITPVKK